MAKGSSNSRKGNGLRTPARRGEKALRAVISFEPNRLSDECLASAYELALPIVQQEPTKRRPKRNNNNESHDCTNQRLVI